MNEVNPFQSPAQCEKSKLPRESKVTVSMPQEFSAPRNHREYRQLVNLLDRLIDEAGENETHPLASMMEILGVLIEKYEDEHVAQLV